LQAADVRDSEGIARAIRAAHKWNAIDVLVCNAGLIRGGYLGDAPVDEMKLMMSTNVEGVLNALHAAIPLLKSRSQAHHRVSIVIMGSLSSLVHTKPSLKKASMALHLASFGHTLPELTNGTYPRINFSLVLHVRP
jgi:NADP-dependent 3-hydroxy acid dehydrogenase YdfG